MSKNNAANNFALVNADGGELLRLPCSGPLCRLSLFVRFGSYLADPHRLRNVCGMNGWALADSDCAIPFRGTVRAKVILCPDCAGRMRVK